MRVRPKVAIVGGGASGIAAFCYLSRQFGNRFEYAIFDPCAPSELGKGQAYGVNGSEFLLNVPMGKMSLWEDHPDDFSEWIRRNHGSKVFAHHPYVPRSLYGEYLHENFAEWRSKTTRFTQVRQAAIDCHLIGKSWRVTTGSGEKQDADLLVIATGYSGVEIPEPFRGLDPNRVLSCFGSDKLESIAASEDLLIIGTGLSAADLALYFIQRKWKGKVTFFSRHGAFPEPHREFSPVPFRLGNFSGLSPRQIFSQVRRFHALLAPANREMELYSALRAQAQAVWSVWTLAEQRRFQRHLEPIWRNVRHRSPKSIHDQIQQELSNGRFKIARGFIRSATTDGRSACIEFSERGTGIRKKINSDRIILATGPKISEKPTIRSWGSAEDSPRLWKIGPVARELFYEVTAMPEIRRQAELITQEIAEEDATGNFDLFLKHGRHLHESYFAHFWKSMSFARETLGISLKAALHAVFPFLYTDAASSRLRDLASKVSSRRVRSVNRALERGSSLTLAEVRKKNKAA